MELYFLSVGYGEAMVVLDKGHCLLIDGGPGIGDAAYEQPGTIPAVTFLKEKQVERIDLMICTHVHNDHVSGLLAVAQQFPVDTFWCNCLHADSPAAAVRTAQPVCGQDLSMRLFAEGLHHWEALLNCLHEQGTVMLERTATDTFEPLWEGLDIRLFGMDKDKMETRRQQFAAFCTQTDPDRQLEQMRSFDSTENQCSLACCLQTSDGWRAMLTGDLCSGWDDRCAKPDFPRAQVLKLTHHGQKDGMPQSLVDACDPEIFVMCADAARTFTSACDTVCQRAQDYLTAHNRPIQVYTTGLLADVLGTQDDRMPCALRCRPGMPADAYYAEGREN